MTEREREREREGSVGESERNGVSVPEIERNGKRL